MKGSQLWPFTHLLTSSLPSLASLSCTHTHTQIVANCMAVDRVHFSVQLFRGQQNPPPLDIQSIDTMPDFSHAVIVEVLRQRGSSMSFHHHCRAVLNAAMSKSNGHDTRNPIHTSPLEFNRLSSSTAAASPAAVSTPPYSPTTTTSSTPSPFLKKPNSRPASIASSPSLLSTRPTKRLARSAPVSTSQALMAVERSLGLLLKDRTDAQRLGMESLVALTDCHTSGNELAVYTAMSLLRTPLHGHNNNNNSMDQDRDDICFEQVHTLLVQLIRDRTLPREADDEEEEERLENSFTSNVSTLYCTAGTKRHDTKENESNTSTAAAPLANKPTTPSSSSSSSPLSTSVDAHHGGWMRSMALRVLSNTLTVLSETQPELLYNTLLLPSSPWQSPSLLQSLHHDVQGGTRFPSVVAGTRFASAHEAALATQCLSILLAINSNNNTNALARRQLLSNKKQGKAGPTLLDTFQQNEWVRHPVLQNTTKEAYQNLLQEY